MQLKLRILIILSLQTLFGKLKLKDIDDAFNFVKEESKYSASIEKLRFSIANPIFGYVFESSGELKQLRMYGPGKKATWVYHQEDSFPYHTDNLIFQLIIELFPSFAGVLSHKGVEYSFESKCTENLVKALDFLADMLLKLLDNTYQPNEYEEFKTIQVIFDFIFSALKYSDQTLYNLGDISKLIMVIHSFVINFISSPIYLTYYLKRICDNIESVEKFEYNVYFKSVIEFEKVKREFLFNYHNQPTIFNNAKYFSNEKNNIRLGDRNLKANHQNLFLLDLCDCIFYDSERQSYSTGNLDKNSKLAKFYENNNLRFEITTGIIGQWIDAIRDYDVLNCTDEELSKLYNGDLTQDALLINMLIKTFNLDNKKFSEGFKQDGTINDKLVYLFENISRISGNDLKIENPKLETLENDTIFLDFFLIIDKKYKLHVRSGPKQSSFVEFIGYPVWDAYFKTTWFIKDDFPFKEISGNISVVLRPTKN